MTELYDEYLKSDDDIDALKLTDNDKSVDYNDAKEALSKLNNSNGGESSDAKQIVQYVFAVSNKHRKSQELDDDGFNIMSIACKCLARSINGRYYKLDNACITHVTGMLHKMKEFTNKKKTDTEESLKRAIEELKELGNKITETITSGSTALSEKDNEALKKLDDKKKRLETILKSLKDEPSAAAEQTAVDDESLVDDD